MSDAATVLERPDALWGSWRVTERVDDVVEIESVRVFRVGVTAEDAHGRIVTGSAATLDGSAAPRAESELYERAALVDALGRETSRLPCRDREGTAAGCVEAQAVFQVSDAPETWQPSRSSGVALRTDWSAACRHAELELIERDRILRSWLGLGPQPARVQMPPGPWTRMTSYEWAACRLPADALSLGDDIEVACIVGFPRVATAPLLRGFGAGHDLDHARDRAVLECLQSLAFLWGEAIPAQAPPPSPTPLYHLDYYLWPGGHPPLRDWVVGNRRACVDPTMSRGTAAGRTVFADITPTEADGRFFVTRALDPRALSLRFGDEPGCARPGAWRPPHPVA